MSAILDDDIFWPNQTLDTSAISQVKLWGQLQISYFPDTIREKPKTAKMPNLKLIAMRLKSVKNIQKITQSMKMVSAAKFAKAERDLKAARPLGLAAQQFYKSAEVNWK